MKYLLLALLFFSSYCNAQGVYQQSTNFGNKYIRLAADTSFIPPHISKLRLNTSPLSKPALISSTQDSTFWFSKGLGLPYDIKLLTSQDAAIVLSMIPVSYDWNFANHDFVFDENRVHDGSGANLTLTNFHDIIFRAKEFMVLDSVYGNSQIKTGSDFSVIIGDVQSALNGTRIDVNPVNNQILNYSTIWNTNASIIQVPNTPSYSTGYYYPLVWNQGTGNYEKCTTCTFGGGDNLSNANLVANGTYTHDWNGKILKILNIDSFYISANEIVFKNVSSALSNNNDSTLSLSNDSNVVRKYYQPYQYKKLTATTNGSTSTVNILKTSNRTPYSIEVNYVGKAISKMISGVFAGGFYGAATVIIVNPLIDIVPEGVFNMNPSGYCTIVISGDDINLEFHSDASDGDISWTAEVKIKRF